MTEENLANCLAELGNITRLRIFMFLIKIGDEGTPVGSIQEHLKIPGSTLSHHLTKLASVNLISQQREGRILYCRANYEVINIVLDQLKINS